MNKASIATGGAEGAALLISTITCPHCGTAHAETMPTDQCQYFYECRTCHTILKPKAGDCCVFCSYGTVTCPPKQTDCCPSKDDNNGEGS